MKPSSLFLRGIALSVAIVVIDQLVKHWCVGLVLDAGGPIEITPFFNLVLVWNKGISFGMLAGHDAWLALVIFTGLMTMGLLVWMWRNADRWIGYALALAIGGAIGNLIDRFLHGAVADFLDFHLYGTHWPAFNIADSAIVTGVCIIALHSFLKPSHSRKESHAHE